jgi:Cupin domain
MNATKSSTLTDLSTQRFGPGGGVYEIVTKAVDTGSAHFAFIATEPPGGGPPLHTHATEDEFFLVLEGEISFWIDGTQESLELIGASPRAVHPGPYRRLLRVRQAHRRPRAVRRRAHHTHRTARTAVRTDPSRTLSAVSGRSGRF